MTREEAIEIASRQWPTAAPGVVDMCVALGMLKLDDTRLLEKKIAVVLWQFHVDSTPQKFQQMLDANGLKIVEK